MHILCIWTEPSIVNGFVNAWLICQNCDASWPIKSSTKCKTNIAMNNKIYDLVCLEIYPQMQIRILQNTMVRYSNDTQLSERYMENGKE